MSFLLLPEQASAHAQGVDRLMLFLTAMTLLLGIAIAVTIVVFAVRYRKDRMVDRSSPPSNLLWLEVLWIGAPLVTVLGIFAWSSTLFFETTQPPPGALEIYGTAKQWMWKFQHPEGPREINELHLPVGTPVRIVLSTEDVIHSFFVPAFRQKQDVVPGRYTSIWFAPTKEGTYHLFCAEYCGTGHSRMVGKVIVSSPAEYEAWLTHGTRVENLVDQGRGLFERLGCNTCHALGAGAGGTVARFRGPALDGLYGSSVVLSDGRRVVADEQYLRESILRPRAQIVAGYAAEMPTFEGRVDESALAALIALLKASTSIPRAAR